MIELRKATREDIPAIERLMHASLRGLAPGYYDQQQIESCIRYTARLDERYPCSAERANR